MKARLLRVGAVGCVFFLSLCVPAQVSPAETMRLSFRDAWHYQGEVRSDSGARTPCVYPGCPYCSSGYCAHGNGSLGHDGSWGYQGSFVDGIMHGRGRLSNDFYEYVGGFDRGEYHGLGVLTCGGGSGDGKRFEGIFERGRLNGRTVGWVGPCDP